MRSLLVLPNALVEESMTMSKDLNVDKVVVILEQYYLNENQHIQKLALMHACLDMFVNLDFDMPVIMTIDYTPKDNEECFICEPLDNKMFNKYSYCTMLPNPSILLSRDEVMNMPIFTRQIDFYKYMRNKYEVLMNEGKPYGNRWSFDIFNRNKFPKNYEEHSEQVYGKIPISIKQLYPRAYGKSKYLYYPSTYKGAKLLLTKFINNKLSNFGKYQDAFDSEIKIGEHANISALVNIGMITPAYIISKVSRSNQNIESVEGFIRQILGWREYMRYVYLRMPNITKNDYLDKLGDTKLPQQWYTGNTGIPIFDDIISKVLETGYAHHIERLMVLNNSMIMYGFSHKEIYKWFMRMFVDSYDWVMIGCSYMNHNSLSSKDKYMGRAYFASGNYIKKMSHYRGDSIDVFDGLFRAFMKRNAQLLKKDYMLASYISRQKKME